MPDSMTQKSYTLEAFQPHANLQLSLKIINETVKLTRNDLLRISLESASGEPWHWQLLTDNRDFVSVQHVSYVQHLTRTDEFTIRPSLPLYTFSVTVLLRFFFLHSITLLSSPHYPGPSLLLEVSVTIPGERRSARRARKPMGAKRDKRK